jgi:hypothetical protein
MSILQRAETSMGEERRVFERKTLKGPARLVRSGAPSLIGHMCDISLGGACVVAESNIPLKTCFQLEFNILVRKTSSLAGIRTSAIVTYVSFSNSDGGFKVGMQFTGLTDAQKQLIVQYMDLRIPKAIAPAAVLAEETFFDEAQIVEEISSAEEQEA